MRAQGLGVVLAAGEDSKFKIGDHVAGAWGMTEYVVVPDKRLEKLESVISFISCISFLDGS
jgi:hypothetical protein